MWSASGGAWHGIARADVFATDAGVQDLRAQLRHALGRGRGGAAQRRGRAAARPRLRSQRRARARLRQRGRRLRRARRARDAEAPPTVGMLYPTELVEDLSMILLYRRWLEARGCRVVTGSPFNLSRAPGGRVGALRPALRRARPPLQDRLVVRARAGARRRRAVRRRRAAGGAARPHRRRRALRAARRHEPARRGRLAEQAHHGALVGGDRSLLAALEQAIRAHCPTRRAWSRCRRRRWRRAPTGCSRATTAAKAPRWSSAPTSTRRRGRRARATRAPAAGSRSAGSPPRATSTAARVNVGVYVVGGEASGYFSRVHRGATDDYATTVATLIEREVSRG